MKVKLSTELVVMGGVAFLVLPAGDGEVTSGERIQGRLNGRPFEAVAQQWGDGTRVVTVSRELRRELGLEGGETVTLTLDSKPRATATKKSGATKPRATAMKRTGATRSPTTVTKKSGATKSRAPVSSTAKRVAPKRASGSKSRVAPKRVTKPGPSKKKLRTGVKSDR